MNADAEFAGLKANLQRLLEDYQEFYDLLLRQRQALIEHNMDELRSVQVDMENVADRIYRHHEHRLAHMEMLSSRWGGEIMSLNDLLARCPFVDGAEMQKTADRLKALRKDIEDLTQTNERLIQAARQTAQDWLENLVGILENRDSRRGRAYDASGTLRAMSQHEALWINRRG